MKTMLEKLSVFLLSLSVIFSAVALSVNADTDSDSNDANDRSSDFIYSINSDDSVSVDIYVGNAARVSIPGELDGKKVTGIKEGAFTLCYNIISIDIPDSIEEVSEYSFPRYASFEEINVDENNKFYSSEDGVLYDKDLNEMLVFPNGKRSAEIPDSVNSLGDRAFQYCTMLESVTLPKELDALEDYAFMNCERLKKIEIPDKVSSISSYAFNDCTALEEIKVGEENDDYTTVNGVLYDKNIETLICCPATKSSLSIPDSVIFIENFAVENCKGIKSITIPENVTYVGDGAFRGCNSLTEFRVVDTNSDFSSVDGVLYNKDVTEIISCPGGKTSLELPDSVTDIGPCAFDRCAKLKTVVIPKGVKSLRQNMFFECSSLTEIIVHSDHKEYTAYNGALYDKDKEKLILCPCGKTSIELPDSCRSIDDEIFDYDLALKEIKVGSKNKSYSSVDGVLYDKDEKTLLRCPVQKESAAISTKAKTISEHSFEGCSKLKSIKIPEGVTSIENGGFSECESLTSVEIPKSMEYISDTAFVSCPSLSDIFYQGTQEEWNDLFGGEYGDAVVTQYATVHFAKETSKEPESKAPSSEPSVSESSASSKNENSGGESRVSSTTSKSETSGGESRVTSTTSKSETSGGESRVTSTTSKSETSGSESRVTSTTSRSETSGSESRVTSTTSKGESSRSESREPSKPPRPQTSSKETQESSTASRNHPSSSESHGTSKPPRPKESSVGSSSNPERSKPNSGILPPSKHEFQEYKPHNHGPAQTTSSGKRVTYSKLPLYIGLVLFFGIVAILVLVIVYKVKNRE